MDKPDEKLSDFFNELKEQDDAIETPSFEAIYLKQKVNRRYWISAGIAASLLILMSMYAQPEKQEKISDDPFKVEIDLEIEEMSTYLLISYQTNVYAWEAPSSSLITDYHEW